MFSCGYLRTSCSFLHALCVFFGRAMICVHVCVFAPALPGKRISRSTYDGPAQVKAPKSVFVFKPSFICVGRRCLGRGSGHVGDVIDAAAEGTSPFAACYQRHCSTNSPMCPKFCEVALLLTPKRLQVFWKSKQGGSLHNSSESLPAIPAKYHV